MSRVGVRAHVGTGQWVLPGVQLDPGSQDGKSQTPPRAVTLGVGFIATRELDQRQSTSELGSSRAAPSPARCPRAAQASAGSVTPAVPQTLPLPTSSSQSWTRRGQPSALPCPRPGEQGRAGLASDGGQRGAGVGKAPAPPQPVAVGAAEWK